MFAFVLRPLGAALLTLSVAACAAPVSAEATSATPVLGIDLGSAPGSVWPDTATSHGGHTAMPPHSGMVMAHAGRNDAHGSGTVNSVDPAAHKINLSHQPIPQIGWPAMTMDFAVDPAVDLRAIKPGAKVNFTIEQGKGGMYEIKALTPAAGAR